MIVNRLFNYLKNGSVATGRAQKILSSNFSNLTSSIDKILLRKTSPLGSIYEEVTNVYEDTLGNLKVDTAPLVNHDDYVDIVNRVANMNDFNRSGDIILLMKDQTKAGSPKERFTTGVACKSWHASLNQSDSYVPLILSYPGGNIKELQKTTGSVCVGAACSGNWALPGLVKDIVNRQY